MFTISKFFLQISSFIFLFFIIFSNSEYLFNKTQFLINITNILSYPAIALSTIVIIYSGFFENIYEKYKTTISNCILIKTLISIIFIIYHLFINNDFHFNNSYSLIWISLTTINVYFLYLLISIHLNNKNCIIPIFVLFFGASIRVLGSLCSVYELASNQFIMNIPLISICFLPLILNFYYRNNTQKNLVSIANSFNYSNENFYSIYIKSLALFLFTIWQYLDFFIITTRVVDIGEFNYGFIFLLGKIGFHITSTLFYILFLFYNFPSFFNFKKHKYFHAIIICISSYLLLHLFIMLLEFYSPTNLFNYGYLSDNKIWFIILFVNFLQSIVYFYILSSSIRSKYLLLFSLCLIAYCAILYFCMISLILEIFLVINIFFVLSAFLIYYLKYTTK